MEKEGKNAHEAPGSKNEDREEGGGRREIGRLRQDKKFGNAMYKSGYPLAPCWWYKNSSRRGHNLI
jgi:hypothetical protein